MCDETSECMKYLSIWFGRNAKFDEHVCRTMERVGGIIRKLERILPRMNKLGFERRRLLVTTAVSALLYAAPVWHTEMAYRKHNAALERANRLLAIKVAYAYRTAPDTAVLVLAKILPCKVIVRVQVDEVGEVITAGSAETKHRAWRTPQSTFCGNVQRGRGVKKQSGFWLNNVSISGVVIVVEENRKKPVKKLNE
ncbi:uncharacterized protein [Euwallacea similis]|uniref:uncharacterized protein n=1 Tax=Euwallacea similis TaxID=1736056 RepID=UPI00344EB551